MPVLWWLAGWAVGATTNLHSSRSLLRLPHGMSTVTSISEKPVLASTSADVHVKFLLMFAPSSRTPPTNTIFLPCVAVLNASKAVTLQSDVQVHDEPQRTCLLSLAGGPPVAVFVCQRVCINVANRGRCQRHVCVAVCDVKRRKQKLQRFGTRRDGGRVCVSAKSADHLCVRKTRAGDLTGSRTGGRAQKQQRHRSSTCPAEKAHRRRSFGKSASSVKVCTSWCLLLRCGCCCACVPLLVCLAARTRAKTE